MATNPEKIKNYEMDVNWSGNWNFQVSGISDFDIIIAKNECKLWELQFQEDKLGR